MLRRILVPLDGSSFAEDALAAAVALARDAGGEIRLVSVVEKPPVFVFPEQFDPERAHADEYLKAVAQRIHALWPGPVSTSVREGWIIDELSAEVGAWSADLITMSTHGRGGVSRLWVGSVADRCVRAGFCPVLLVRPNTISSDWRALHPGRVVIPLDGSQLAERALPYGAAAAKAFGVPMLLLRVVSQPAGAEFTHHPDAMEVVQRLRHEDEQDAREYLEARVKELEQRGLEASTLVTSEAGPAEVIVDRAAGDLIVMCTRGRGSLERALFGSVADKVVRGGSQPVLVVPAERRARRGMGERAAVIAALSAATSSARAR
jgi:nucleotide-binding universal stress UspA family protein